MTTFLGASYRTGLIGVALIALSAVLFYLDQKAEAAVCFTTGIGFLNSRDSSVTSQEQSHNPGLMTAAPDLTASEYLAPTVNQMVERKINELVTPQIQALDKAKADK